MSDGDPLRRTKKASPKASPRASRSSRAWARFRRRKSAVLGLAVVVALFLFALLGPLVARHDPNASDFVHGTTGADGLPVPPGARFWLGTDRIFRDQFARLAVGARLSLAIAIASTAISSTLGAAAGIVSGYYEGSVADAAIMRTVDVGLSFPFLLLVMALGAALDHTSAGSILVVLGLTGWLGTARILRAKTMQIRTMEYIAAARALGATTPSILVRHVLPNVLGPLLVLATLSVAQMTVAESVLSYLGVGIAPPTPTWGTMLAEGQEQLSAAPWLLLAPGGAIFLSVFGWNLLGEGLRDALDPKETS